MNKQALPFLILLFGVSQLVLVHGLEIDQPSLKLLSNLPIPSLVTLRRRKMEFKPSP